MIVLSKKSLYYILIIYFNLRWRESVSLKEFEINFVYIKFLSYYDINLFLV